MKSANRKPTAPCIPSALENHYSRVRIDSERLCEPLQTEDYGVQTGAEISPPKWHLAHTNWFFETFLLQPYLQAYTAFHPLYARLFNSYYDTVGSYHPRPERGLLSRPTVMEIYSYRAHIDKHMKQLLSLRDHPHYHDIVKLGTLGLHHEQQHQELLLTDIKHIFAYNPLRPVYKELPLTTASVHPNNHWVNFTGGLHSIGYSDEDFAYDNESPRHKVYLNDFQLAQRLVTNREYMQFMREGGYSESNFWLSDAWKLINTQNWSAPLYWEQIDGEWWHMTLAGMRRVDPNAPVSHVSYYEAAAYAQWAQARLPTEAEWEVAAADVDIKGNLRESGYLQPIPLQCDNSDNTKGTMLQMYGDVWEWTQSPYVSYPGYRQAQGAMGEYNGKFMSGQMVLRGGSCVTPNDHIRPSYRNFFYPNERWQFTGFRLARD